MTGLKIKIREFIYEDLIFPEDEVFEKRDKLFAHIPSPRVDYDPIIYRELGNINGKALHRQSHVPDILDTITKLSSNEVPTPPEIANAIINSFPDQFGKTLN